MYKEVRIRWSAYIVNFNLYYKNLLSKVNRIISYYKLRLARLPDSNYAISSGFACGAMVSFTPLLGFHFVLAVVFAYLIRGNFIAALIGVGGAFLMVPAMIYLIGMPIKLIPGTSLFVTIFISAIVTILHAFNYGTIDLILVTVLILGSILGVQIGQKIGEKVDSSQFKTILAMLLLLVGIAIAYDTFFVEEVIKQTSNNGSKTLGPISQFVRDLSKNVPVLYGLFSIVLALVLGVGAAILRRFLSNLKKKFVYTAPPASQK